MNDGHVPLSELLAMGGLTLTVAVLNGTTTDPTYQNYQPPHVYLPWPPWVIFNNWSANPGGAQEWRGLAGGNYCALNYTCKQRRGNVGGNVADPGNPCPANDPANYEDNFFWGRTP